MLKAIVDRFSQQSDQVCSPDYNETLIRVDFINPNADALGNQPVDPADPQATDTEAAQAMDAFLEAEGDPVEQVVGLADPEQVRQRMGLTGQYAAVDEVLTGRENLIMFGRLYRLTAKSAKTRAE